MNSRSEGGPITAVRILAVSLILAGAVGLAYSKVGVVEEHTAAQVGPVSMTVRTDHRVTVPVWAGVAAIVLGGVMLLGTTRAVRS